MELSSFREHNRSIDSQGVRLSTFSPSMQFKSREFRPSAPVQLDQECRLDSLKPLAGSIPWCDRDEAQGVPLIEFENVSMAEQFSCESKLIEASKGDPLLELSRVMHPPGVDYVASQQVSQHGSYPSQSPSHHSSRQSL